MKLYRSLTVSEIRMSTMHRLVGSFAITIITVLEFLYTKWTINLCKSNNKQIV